MPTVPLSTTYAGKFDPFFLAQMDVLAPQEGGYTNDPDDSGGETNLGITVADARAYGYAGAMVSMTWDAAMPIYFKKYYTNMQLDQLAKVSPAIAALCFNWGVNMGVTWPGKFLQRALNVLNVDGTQWADMGTPDGVVFEKTRFALSAYLRQRGKLGETAMVGIMRGFAVTRYAEIAESNPKNRKFTYGWMTQRALGLST